jgi:hypothetical protein
VAAAAPCSHNCRSASLDMERLSDRADSGVWSVAKLSPRSLADLSLRGVARSLNCAVDGGSADGEQFGEFGGGVFAGAVEANEVALLGWA